MDWPQGCRARADAGTGRTVQPAAEQDRRAAMGRYVKAGELEIWTEQVGDGPDVLLIGGLGDTVES